MYYCKFKRSNSQILQNTQFFFNLYNQGNINQSPFKKFQNVLMTNTISEAGLFEFVSEIFFVLMINDDPLERKRESEGIPNCGPVHR